MVKIDKRIKTFNLIFDLINFFITIHLKLHSNFNGLF